MEIFFSRTKSLIKQIDQFLELVSQGMLLFQEGVKHYLSEEEEHFMEKMKYLREKEGLADNIKRDIENKLYSHSLIPQYRGDVLGLLENMDHVLDRAKKTLTQFEIERPEIEAELHHDFLLLTEASVNCAEMIVLSTGAFFRSINNVKDNLHKVYHYEKESDSFSHSLKRKIFGKEWGLSKKIHLCSFANNIDKISDQAQDVADRLAIYTIKRNI